MAMTESRAWVLLPIGIGCAGICLIVYETCKAYASENKKRDLEMMELGIKIGSGIQKAVYSMGSDNGEIDTKQNGASEGGEGQETSQG